MGASTTIAKNCTRGILTVFCTVLHCAYPSSWKVRRSVDEQELRHLQVLVLGLLVLELHDHRDVNRQTTTATICSWICGTSAASATQYRGISDAMKRISAHVRVELLTDPENQAITSIAVRCLPSTSRVWSPRSLLGHWPYSRMRWEWLPTAKRAPNLAASKQLHRSIKHRQGRRAVSRLLHGVPQHPLLRSRQGKQPVWPGARGIHIFDVQRKVLSARRPGRWFLPGSRRVVLLVPTSRPWPFLCPLGLCGASTRPGLWRSAAARASRQRAVVALFTTMRLP